MTTESENIQPENIQPEIAPESLESTDLEAKDLELKKLETKSLEVNGPESKDSKAEGAGLRKDASGHTKWWLLALVAVGLSAFGLSWLIFHKPAATPEPAADAVPQQPGEALESAPPADPEAIAEQEAAARAEFDAKMAQVNSVIQSTGREALIGDSPTKGPADAAIVFIKFSDFECPFCAVAAADMKTFADNHEDDVLYIYKHFPLVSIHDEAVPAAKAAWAAQQQDQFWIYHDGLFAYQEKLGEDYYVELAEQIGLDMEQFERDRNSPEAEAAVTQEAELARELELGGTPSFLMTNFTDSFLLPGGAPQELYDEAVARLEAAAQ